MSSEARHVPRSRYAHSSIAVHFGAGYHVPHLARAMPDLRQVAHQSFGGQKQWESSPDFKIVHGTSRGGSLTSWAGRAAALGAGAGIGGGNPAFAGGSPGRAELARAMQRTASRSGSVDEFVVGSPLKQQQVRNAPAKRMIIFECPETRVT